VLLSTHEGRLFEHTQSIMTTSPNMIREKTGVLSKAVAFLTDHISRIQDFGRFGGMTEWRDGALIKNEMERKSG
jgi:hypothetical protein